MNRTFPRFGYNPVTGDWNDSLVGQFAWSNVNVSEAVPDVMTPSTWSLWWIFHYEASPFQFPGAYPFCDNISGRPYLNLSILVSVYRAIGRDARKELQGDFIVAFPRPAAIVTDVGAPLSHAAIIARELGIPAVVDCGNATMLLKTGDRVRVDGARGVVKLLDRVEGNK